jgi:hypothetical protein
MAPVGDTDQQCGVGGLTYFPEAETDPKGVRKQW